MPYIAYVRTNSPEAVEQAAETIRELGFSPHPFDAGRVGLEGDLRAEVERLREEAEVDAGARRIVAKQRDALAEALLHFYEHGYDRAKAEAALRACGRLP